MKDWRRLLLFLSKMTLLAKGFSVRRSGILHTLTPEKDLRRGDILLHPLRNGL